MVAAGVGVVEGLGSDVSGFTPGQRVVNVPSADWSALNGSGTWQEYMLVPAANLVGFPAACSVMVVRQDYEHHVN